MKRKLAIGIVVIAVAAFVGGTGILAFAELGTQDDPLITLSYLTEVFKKQVMDDTKKAEQELAQKLESRISELEAELETRPSAPTPIPGGTDVFSVVTLNNGQSLTCSVGTEIMLRIGTATGFGSAPALVDYTDGATLSSGTALVTNHMYLVTIEGNGARATAGTVRILVRGNYKIT
ncbi:MAG: hypothetical protein FWH57_02335 [Oscillospiraceae bacterium]|nr:hypothetical protein [Oscillospiraceae bacterium]